LTILRDVDPGPSKREVNSSQLAFVYRHVSQIKFLLVEVCSKAPLQKSFKQGEAMQSQKIVARVRAMLLASTALIVGAPGLASAQTAPTAAAQAAPASSALEEVVVTAERHESVAQHTAAQIDLVTDATLLNQRVTQLTDLNSVLLDTQIVPVLTNIQVSIRGIGSNFVDQRADPAVATSINGLFYDRALPVGFAFLDVSRVEVLEGPQGTLYGRNSAAGAVNIITNQPTDQFGGSLRATVGNLGENEVTGVINVPVDDTLAFRAAYDRDRRDGYLGGYYDDVHSDTGRLSARWTPTARLSVYVEGNYSQLGGHGAGVAPWGCAGAKPYSLYVPKSCAFLGSGGDIEKNGTNRSYVDSGLVNITYDFGPIDVTSISGYVGTHNRDFLPDGTLFNQGIRSDSNDYSEELRFAGHDTAAHAGGFEWQAGAYLFDSNGSYLFNQEAYPVGSPLYLGNPIYNKVLNKIQTYSKIPQNSKSVYAQATYGITDRLRITGGLRYGSDSKGLQYSQFSYPTVLSPSESITAVGKTTASGDKWSYKGGLEYDLGAENLLYGNISTGYVAGGVNGGSSTAPLTLTEAPATFLPETLTSYEVGSKNRFMDDRLQINGDFFYYDFHNYQYLIPAYVQGGGPVSDVQIQNAASAKDYGAELNGEFALTSDDLFSASVAWSHARFGALSFAGVAGVSPNRTNVAPGSRIPNDPDWGALLGYQHTFRLADGDFITLSANTKLSSKNLLVVGSVDPADTQKGYTRTDASLAYHWADDKYELQVWAKNLENKPVDIYGEGVGFHVYGIEPPRTYGLTVSANF
jgi:iron complex outermembrane receptor protein